jgi:hypothetical protein
MSTTTKKSVIAAKSVPDKVMQVSEEEEEEEENETTTVVTEVKKPKVRPGQKSNDILASISGSIVEHEIEGNSVQIIIMTEELKAAINKELARFAKGGKGNSVKPVSDTPKQLFTFYKIAGMYEKNEEFIKAYINTPEHKNVFSKVASSPLLTSVTNAKGIVEDKFSTEISGGWKVGTKAYNDEKKFPILHKMLKEKYDIENAPRIAELNAHTARDFKEMKDGKHVKYTNADKSKYRLWDNELAKWGQEWNASATVPGPKTTRPGKKAAA